MSHAVNIPSVGESISEVTIANWIKKTGDRVQRDEPVCEIESDKATVELVAEADGVLTVLIEEGENVAIGTKVGEIAPGEAVVAATPAPEPKPTPEPTTGHHYAQGHPSPAARKILAEREVATPPSGTGRDGRITKGDALSTTPSSSPPTTTTTQETARKKMSGMRKAIAKRLVEAKNTTAMLTTFNEVDMQNLISLRKKYQEQFLQTHGIKLGFMSLFTKSLTQSLRHFPEVAAIIEGDELLHHRHTHVGIAVSTPKGLVVPVVRNADSLGLAEIEKEILRLANKAKEGKLSMSEMSGGTITITNGGIFGSMLSTPILNIPQSAILGMHNIVQRPVAVDGQVVIRPIMYLALSYDHRVIDGKESVGFLKSIKEYIEDPAKMLLDL